jgi:hypothetical protein
LLIKASFDIPLPKWSPEIIEKQAEDPSLLREGMNAVNSSVKL